MLELLGALHTPRRATLEHRATNCFWMAPKMSDGKIRSVVPESTVTPFQLSQYHE